MRMYKILIMSFVASFLALFASLGGVIVHQFFTAILGYVFTISQTQTEQIVKIMAAFLGLSAFAGFWLIILSLLDPLRRPGYISSVF